MWLRARLQRLQTRFAHLFLYLRTLSKANEIERKTDLHRTFHPVLLLYGYGATRRSLSILESRLREDGFDVFSIRLGGLMELFNTAPIDRLATELEEKIERLCGRHPFQRLSIIGYSKGGLIGRYYVTCLGGAKRVHTLITLATPHKGNPWIRWSCLFLIGFFSRGLRQMRPLSKFIRELEATPLPEKIHAVSIYSEKDRVCPPPFSRWDTPKAAQSVTNVALRSLHHSDFILKQRAYQLIYEHLMEGFHRLLSSDGGGLANAPRSLLKKVEYWRHKKSREGEAPEP